MVISGMVWPLRDPVLTGLVQVFRDGFLSRGGGGSLRAIQESYLEVSRGSVPDHPNNETI